MAIAVAAMAWSVTALSDAGYRVTVTNAMVNVGAEGSVRVKVDAGDGFKCNASYPHKIVDIAAEGVEAPKTVTGNVSPDGRVIAYAVPVRPTQEGVHTVAGEIRFQVCNDSGCFLKKVPLQATVTGVRE